VFSSHAVGCCLAYIKPNRARLAANVVHSKFTHSDLEERGKKKEERRRMAYHDVTSLLFQREIADELTGFYRIQVEGEGGIRDIVRMTILPLAKHKHTRRVRLRIHTTTSTHSNSNHNVNQLTTHKTRLLTQGWRRTTMITPLRIMDTIITPLLQ
jgi:hypothetical protein